MRAPGLHEVRVLPGLRGENIGELVQLLAQRLRELEVRQAHRGRRHVVRRLAHVHVIVGTHVLVGAEAPAADLVRAIGDDLVDVHVERHARAGMEHIDNELIQQLSGEDLIASGDDRVLSLGVQPTFLAVRERSGALHADHRAHERRERLVTGDRVVLDRSLGLRAPQRVGRDLYLSERVLLTTRRHRGLQ